MSTHRYKVGERIKLTNSGPVGRYDGTTSEYGTIMCLSFDEDLPTYGVEFDDGEVELHLYPDEFEVSNEQL